MSQWILTHLAGHGLSPQRDFVVTFTFLFGGMTMGVYQWVKQRNQP